MKTTQKTNKKKMAKTIPRETKKGGRAKKGQKKAQKEGES